MRMGPVFFLAAFPLALGAQTQASLGVGVGTVRYAGGSTFSAGTFSPAVQRIAPSFYVAAGGSLSMLKDGVWASQARTDVWAALPRRERARPQLAVSVNLATSARSDGVASGAGAVIAEVLQARGARGAAIGVGPSAGVIEGAPGAGALHLRARAWWQMQPAQLSLSVEPIHFAGAWYTDVAAGATVDRGRIVGSVWLSGRLSAAFGSKGGASAALQYFVSPTVSLEGSVGTYLSDPFQGLPRVGFVSAGARVQSHPRALAPTPPVPPQLSPLIAQRRGDSVVVRFRMSGAHSVAIAGDWNAWRSAPLRGVGADIWEGALVLAPGTYHFNLVVDDTDWVVPGGVAVVSDGMGGMVAVLVVP